MSDSPAQEQATAAMAAALSPLTALVREHVPVQRADEDAAAAAAYERMELRRGSSSSRWRRRQVAVWLAPLCAGLVILVVMVVRNWRTPQLSFVVEGGAVAEGGFVRGPVTGQTRLHFSDGTAITLDRSSRGRVASTTAHGARVILDQGRAQVKVVPHKDGHWIFDAGPCLVQVTGTTFDMNWSAPEQRLEVSLFTGSLTVRGPPAPQGVQLHHGQRLIMDVRDGSVRVEALTAPAPEVSPLPAPASLPMSPSGRVTPPATPAVRPAVTTHAPRTVDAWPAMVSSGRGAEVLREAGRLGLDLVTSRLSALDVMALADAARHAGRVQVARQALLAVRSRFPESPPALKAAYLLGCLAEDADGDPARALEWYDVYLSDPAGGSLREEALGRKMTAVLHLRGRTNARDAAAEYLRHFPSGSYAQPARAILDGT